MSRAELELAVLRGLVVGDFNMPDDAAEILDTDLEETHEAFTRLTLRGWIAPPLTPTGKGIAFYDQLEATLRDAPEGLFDYIDSPDYRRIAQATYLRQQLPQNDEMDLLGVVGLALMLATIENPDSGDPS